MKKWLLFRMIFTICFLSITELTFAQEEQIIVGQVIDRETFKPVSHAVIRFHNSPVVTQSNDEGYFFLKGDGRYTIILFSADGYATERVKIKPHRSAAVNIALKRLKETELPLETVQKDRKATAIIQQIIQNKPLNNPEKGHHPSTESERVKAYMYHLPQQWIQGTQVAHAATFSVDSLYTLPLFTEDKIYRQPTYPSVREQKEIFSNRELSILPVGKEYMQNLVGLFLPHENFYNNKVINSGNYFFSPIANDALSHYGYFLKDSSFVNGRKTYDIGFLPLHKNEYLYKGFLSVDSASAALTHIHVEIPRNIHINFVKSISIDQYFSLQNNRWYYSSITNFLILDITSIGPFRKKHLEVAMTKEILLEPPQPNNEDLIMLNQRRTETQIHPTNDSLYQRLERFNQTSLMKKAAWLTDLFMYQYAHWGKIDIGPFNQLYHNNAIDGPTGGLALRTNQRLWKNFSIGGNIGYAFRDDSWKFGGVTLYRLPTHSFQQIDLQYNKNAYQTGFNEDIFLVSEGKVSPSENDVFSSFFRYHPDTVVNEVASWRFRYQREWTREFKTTVTFYNNRIYSNKYIRFIHNNDPVESFLERGAKIDFRLSRDQLVWDNCYDRRYISNQFPVFHFQLDGGNFAFGHITGNYFKLLTTINHTVSFEGGSVYYIAEAGYILGNVPFPLLAIARGNETYTFSAYNFNLMNNLEYAGDKYVQVHVHYYSSGLILNKIPIIKKLHLLESFSLKMAEAGLRKGYDNILTMPSGMQPIDVPYIEGGVGVYNILSLLGVEYIARITHRNDPNANKWGIRFYFHINL
ncbi:MAG: DUF5686 family protein [Microbacter sp.]